MFVCFGPTGYIFLTYEGSGGFAPGRVLPKDKGRQLGSE